MTLDKAKELLAMQAGFSSGYNRNSAKLMMAEVERKHGQQAALKLVKEFNLDQLFGF
ncbi:MAG: hypothetical protein OEX83_01530 [Gammaproteobacteria bacterium]|nr:hypothetical protein [Gammaproteobacteria bacterium]